MASKNSNVQAQNAANQQRRARTEAYAQQVKAEYAQAVNAILALQKKLPQLDPGVMYSFDGDSPQVRKEVDKVLRNLYAANMTTIKTGIASEWEEANKEVDKLITSAVGKKALKNPHLAGWFARNEEAMETFTNRSENGMNLSDRVWKNAQQFRDEMEIAMTVAIGEGQSASQMSRKVRQYLDDPDLMFRRFRYKDEDGNWRLKWKKRVQTNDGHFKFIDYDRDSYKTGAGVYKSSYKNAMRVTRTETNMAYRRADHDRWQNLEFVLGQNITPSKSHDPEEDKDICDQLKGKYPKDFVFEGWHPQCMCSCTAIMVSEDEMQKCLAARLQGEDYQFKEKPVTTYPEGFQKFVRENKDNILGAQQAGKLPYFLKENYSLVEQVFNGVDITDPQSFATPTQTATAEQSAPQMTPSETIDYWKKNGIDVRLDGFAPEDLSPSLLKFDPVKIVEQMRRITGKPMDGVHVECKNPKEMKFYAEGNSGRLLFLQDVFISRVFKVQSNGSLSVNHNVFQLNEKLQGKGISRETFRAFYDQYREMGVSKINAHANIDVGGYTWARYGFSTDSKLKAEKAVTQRGPEQLQKKALKIIDDYYKENGLSDKSSFPMNRLVEKLGKDDAKKLLLNSEWRGTIDLTNPTQRAVFEKYMGWQPKTAPASQPKTAPASQPSTLEKARARQARRTEAQKKDIQKRWDATRAQHQEIRDNAAKTLAMAGEYKDLDTSKLQAFTKNGDLTRMKRQTALLEKEIKEQEAEEKKLADIIPDVHKWHKDFTLEQLKAVYDSTKKNLDKWDTLSLDKQAKKLKFEAEDFLGGNMKGVQQKYVTWQVSQAAYRKRLNTVQYKIDVKDVEDKLAPIQQWVANHPEAKKVANLYYEAKFAVTHGESSADINTKYKDLEVVYRQRVAAENAKAKANAQKTMWNASTGAFAADAYTQKRKDKALWAKTVRKADKMVRDVCGEVWRNATKKQREAIYAYTEEYCNINEPLRGLTYINPNPKTDPNKPQRGIDRIAPMTEIIDKSSYKHDMWLQRGGNVQELLKFGINISRSELSDPAMIKSLVGRVGTEGAFMSCGVAKGKGLTGNVILNVYAPAGTKMMYVEPFSKYGKGTKDASWDGVSKQATFGDEAEMILQRGTQLRITKAEYAGGHLYIDVEVIGQNVVPFPYKGGYPFNYK